MSVPPEDLTPVEQWFAQMFALEDGKPAKVIRHAALNPDPVVRASIEEAIEKAYPMDPLARALKQIDAGPIRVIATGKQIDIGQWRRTMAKHRPEDWM